MFVQEYISIPGGLAGDTNMAAVPLSWPLGRYVKTRE